MCADYIDARIVRDRGYLDKKKLYKDLMKEAITYGNKRYIYINKKGELARQTEKGNKRRLKRIKSLLDFEANKKVAEVEAKSCEEFLTSDTFMIYMPNTDGKELINILRRRAKQRNRMNSGYPDIF